MTDDPGARGDEVISVDEIRHGHDAEGNLTLADGSRFELDTGEFSTRE